jgi:hypothetical protein
VVVAAAVVEGAVVVVGVVVVIVGMRTTPGDDAPSDPPASCSSTGDPVTLALIATSTGVLRSDDSHRRTSVYIPHMSPTTDTVTVTDPNGASEACAGETTTAKPFPLLSNRRASRCCSLGDKVVSSAPGRAVVDVSKSPEPVALMRDVRLLLRRPV